MALVVEDGTGLTNADSYASVAQADAYHAARGNSDWTGPLSQKERALRRASEAVDRMYDWVGYRNSKEQALAWPRTGGFDSDGFGIEVDEIPGVLVAGVAELAMRLLCQDEAPDVSGIDALTTSLSESAGEVSISRGLGGAPTRAPRFPKVDQVLAPVTAAPCLERA